MSAVALLAIPPLGIGINTIGVDSATVTPVGWDWERLCYELSSVKVGRKDGAYFTRCTFTHDRRSDKNAHNIALVILDGDGSIDPETGEELEGAPDPHLVHEVLRELDITHCLYSSYSNGAKGHRYRVVVPAALRDGNELAQVVAWLIEQLHSSGVYLRDVTENSNISQPWYFPRGSSAEALERFVFLRHDGGSLPVEEILAGRSTLATTAATAPTARVGDAGLLTHLLSGTELHSDALTLTARLVRQGVEPALISAMFAGLRPHLEASRGAERVRQLLDDGELARMIEGAQAKGYRQTAGTPRFALTPISELLERPAPLRWLVEDYILPEAQVLLFGDPATGKSLVAVDWAARIALGMPWAGRDVTRGPVCYIAGEGHFGIRRRLKAWALHHGVEEQLLDAPLAVSRSGTSLVDPRAVGELVEGIEAFAANHGAPALIVFDTLHRNLGGSENDEEDIGAMLRVLDELRVRWGCTSLVVHHSGHGDKDRGRGSSSLRAGIDIEYKVAVSGTARVLSCPHKFKDGPTPPPVGFDLVPVELPWTTAKGKPETSVVAIPIAAEECVRPTGRPMPGNVRLGLETFFEAEGGKPLHIEAWRHAFYRRSTADTQDTKRRGFERCRKDMVAAGALAVADDVYTLAGPPNWADWQATVLRLGMAHREAA